MKNSRPERARAAAKALSTGETREDDSLGIRLLADVRLVFNAKICEKLPNKELVRALVRFEEAHWSDMRGKPLDQSKLAALLKPYHVKPKGLRIRGKTSRGYERADFEDVRSRYIPSAPAEGATGTAQSTVQSSLEGHDVAGVARLQERNGNAPCSHRPTGEAESLWELGPATWGEDGSACS